MQCPNCGKEALNVNGRYVCLDCGIEIASNGSPVQYQDPTATSVNNHATQTENPAAQIQDTPAIWNNNQPQNPTPTETPATAPAAAQESNSSVRDYYMESLTKMAGGEESAPSAPTDDSSQAVVPDFPEPDKTGPTLDTPPALAAAPAPLPTPETAPIPEVAVEAPQNITEPQPAPPAVDVAPVAPEPVDLPQVEPASEPVDNNVAAITEPDSYFQPATFNIAPTAQAQDQALPPTPEITPIVEAQPSVEQPPVLTPENTLQNPPHLADEPAEVVSSPISQPATYETESKTTLPGVSGIPSAESVFGPSVNNATPNEDNFVMKKGISFKKIVIVILITVAAIALLGGIVYSIMYFVNSRNTSGSGKVDAGKVLNISATVSSKMDGLAVLSNNFEQTIDLTGLTSKTIAGAEQQQSDRTVFFSKIAAQKGVWKLDQAGDSSFDGEVLGKQDKRVYIRAEDITYVFSPETTTWIKVPGMQLNVIPPLYPLESKGSLFYALRAANIVDSGKETINGTQYRKYQIVPQKEVITELLVATNPTLLTGLNLDASDLSNFKLYAFLDAENRIYKVTADGEITINSNYASGVIKINSQGVYNYNTDINVAKP